MLFCLGRSVSQPDFELFPAGWIYENTYCLRDDVFHLSSALQVYLKAGRPKLVRPKTGSALFLSARGVAISRKTFWLGVKQAARFFLNGVSTSTEGVDIVGRYRLPTDTLGNLLPVLDGVSVVVFGS